VHCVRAGPHRSSLAHFATFPPDLIEPCIKAGSAAEGIVLDPFGGSGTTPLVANRLGRNTILLEINPDYADMARNRLIDTGIDQDSISMCRCVDLCQSRRI
jgi:DNA modification methylase